MQTINDKIYSKKFKRNQKKDEAAIKTWINLSILKLQAGKVVS